MIVFDVSCGCNESRILKKSAVGNGHVDPRQVLVDYATSSEVEMTGFSVARLAFGEADRFAVGDKLGVDVGIPQRLDVGSLGLGDGIAWAGWSQAPAIEDAEDDRFGTG